MKTYQRSKREKKRKGKKRKLKKGLNKLKHWKSKEGNKLKGDLEKPTTKNEPINVCDFDDFKYVMI